MIVDDPDGPFFSLPMPREEAKGLKANLEDCAIEGSPSISHQPLPSLFGDERRPRLAPQLSLHVRGEL